MKKRLLWLLAFLILTGCAAGSVFKESSPEESSSEEPSSEESSSEESDSEEGAVHQITYAGSYYGFSETVEEAQTGTLVTLVYDIWATDTDYGFYVDGEPAKVRWVNEAYVISFIMPDHDVEVRVDSRETMEYIDPGEPEVEIEPYDIPDPGVDEFRSGQMMFEVILITQSADGETEYGRDFGEYVISGGESVPLGGPHDLVMEIGEVKSTGFFFTTNTPLTDEADGTEKTQFQLYDRDGLRLYDYDGDIRCLYILDIPLEY